MTSNKVKIIVPAVSGNGLMNCFWLARENQQSAIHDELNRIEVYYFSGHFAGGSSELRSDTVTQVV